MASLSRDKHRNGYQFFAEALERGLIDANPFAKLPCSTRGNEKRQQFIPAEWIHRCIEAAGNE